MSEIMAQYHMSVTKIFPTGRSRLKGKPTIHISVITLDLILTDPDSSRTP